MAISISSQVLSFLSCSLYYYYFFIFKFFNKRFSGSATLALNSVYIYRHTHTLSEPSNNWYKGSHTVLSMYFKNENKLHTS